jgi:hypothetical protein
MNTPSPTSPGGRRRSTPHRRSSNADEDRGRQTPPIFRKLLLWRGSGHETGVPNSPPLLSTTPDPDSANKKMIISPTKNLSSSRRNRVPSSYSSDDSSSTSGGLETIKRKGSSHSDNSNKSYSPSSNIGIISPPSAFKKKFMPLVPNDSPPALLTSLESSTTNLLNSRSRRRNTLVPSSDGRSGLETSKRKGGSSHSDKSNKSYSIGIISPPSAFKKKFMHRGITSPRASSHSTTGSILDASSGHRDSKHFTDHGPTSPQLLSPNAVRRKFLPKALIKRMGKKSPPFAFDGNTSGVTALLHGHNSFAGHTSFTLDASGVTTFDGYNSFAGHHSGISALDASGITTLDGRDSFALLGEVKNNSNAAAERIPRLYRHARKCRWDELFLEQCQVFPENVRYVYPKDGTTALHMAVMSRTGYINSFKSSGREFPEASLAIVEELLKIHPEAANVKCTLNGYTPLTYACLVCSDSYEDVEQAAKMVRLFVQYAPNSALLLTNAG